MSNDATIVQQAAFEMRGEAERVHGCNIGFEPRKPCRNCFHGRLADDLWQVAKRLQTDKEGS